MTWFVKKITYCFVKSTKLNEVHSEFDCTDPTDNTA